MSYSDRIKQNIFKYIEKDYEEIFTFYKKVWPNDQTKLNEKIWRWKLFQNPNNPNHLPQLWVYKSDNKIKGQIVSVPFKLKVKDQYILASWGIDLMVSEEYKMKGIGPLLVREVCDNTDIFIALGVTEDAYRMFKTMKWIDMGKLSSYVYILNYKPYLNRKLGNILSNLLSPFVNMAMRTKNIHNWMTMVNNITHEKVDNFDERISRFWEKVSIDYDFAVRRDASYLTWRYLKNPYRQYDTFRLKQDKENLAYCITRIAHENGVRVGYIVDLLVKKKDVNIVLFWALKYFKEMKVDSIVCDIINKDIEDILTKFGFSRRETSKDYMIKINRPELNSSSITEKKNWFVTRGDSDIEYIG